METTHVSTANYPPVDGFYLVVNLLQVLLWSMNSSSYFFGGVGGGAA